MHRMGRCRCIAEHAASLSNRAPKVDSAKQTFALQKSQWVADFPRRPFKSLLDDAEGTGKMQSSQGVKHYRTGCTFSLHENILRSTPASTSHYPSFWSLRLVHNGGLIRKKGRVEKCNNPMIHQSVPHIDVHTHTRCSQTSPVIASSFHQLSPLIKFSPQHLIAGF